MRPQRSQEAGCAGPVGHTKALEFGCECGKEPFEDHSNQNHLSESQGGLARWKLARTGAILSASAFIFLPSPFLLIVAYMFQIGIPRWCWHSPLSEPL